MNSTTCSILSDFRLHPRARVSRRTRDSTDVARVPGAPASALARQAQPAQRKSSRSAEYRPQVFRRSRGHAPHGRRLTLGMADHASAGSRARMEEADGGRNGAGSRTRLRWTRIPRSLISSSRTCGTICHPERRPAAVTAEPFAGWILCAAACPAHPSTLMKGHRGGTQRIALPRGSLESNQVDGSEVVCLAGEGPMAVTGPSSPAAPRQPPCGERLSADARVISAPPLVRMAPTPRRTRVLPSSLRIACS
jgi:hypothetical protein